MGTNYYLQKECPECGHRYRAHIGKSSGGWCFSLHVDPENDIRDIDDWEALCEKDGWQIVNEYGEKKAWMELYLCITDRGCVGGLLRHPIDGTHCIGHGSGTWDLITGEFS